MAFFTDDPATDSAYLLNRDNPNRKWLREHLENLWTKFEPLCGDKNFLSQARKDFHSAAWTMHLAHVLRSKGMRLVPVPGEGPDICVRLRSGRCWIEAINLNRGTGPDQVPPRAERFSYSSEEQHILKITSGLVEKRAKYAGWRENGLLLESEPYIVAMNAGLLTDADLTDGISYAEKALLGLGKYTWVIEVPSGKSKGAYYPGRKEVQKKNQSAVECGGFTNHKYAEVSAVIYTPYDIANNYDRDGSDFFVIHNPHARNPIPRGTFRLGTEKWIDDNLLRGLVWHHHVRLFHMALRMRAWLQRKTKR